MQGYIIISKPESQRHWGAKFAAKQILSENPALLLECQLGGRYAFYSVCACFFVLLLCMVIISVLPGILIVAMGSSCSMEAFFLFQHSGISVFFRSTLELRLHCLLVNQPIYNAVLLLILVKICPKNFRNRGSIYVKFSIQLNRGLFSVYVLVVCNCYRQPIFFVPHKLKSILVKNIMFQRVH